MTILVAVVSSVLVTLFGLLWYNARKAARSETIADAEMAARESAQRRTEALENARLREEAAARERDEDEGSAIVRDGDARAARDYLLRSIPAPDPRKR